MLGTYINDLKASKNKLTGFDERLFYALVDRVKVNKDNIIIWKDIACAVYAKCDAFITTDKGILKKKIHDIKVLNPIDFMRETCGNKSRE